MSKVRRGPSTSPVLPGVAWSYNVGRTKFKPNAIGTLHLAADFAEGTDVT